MRRVISFLLTWKKTSIFVSVLAVLVGYFVFREPELDISVVAVTKGTVEQEVSVPGRVVASDDIDLAFEKSGRIISVRVEAGDEVVIGKLLVQLDSSELLAQRAQYVASVQSVQVAYDRLVAGAEDADIRVMETTLENAERSLDIAVKKDAVDTGRTSFTIATSALVTLSDIQNLYFGDNSNDSLIIVDKKERALHILYGVQGMGRVIPSVFLTKTGGLRADLATMELNPTTENVSDFLTNIKRALNAVSEALDVTYGAMNSTSATDAQKTSISTSRTSILAQLALVTTEQQAIITAENTARDARAKLDQLEAPATKFELDIAQADLAKAHANLALVNAQIAKNSLRAPISGIVSKVEGVRGELVIANSVVITLISDAKFRIESQIPEADIAKIQVGQEAMVTLDAYGSDVIFDSIVLSVEPGENLQEGVATYKTVFVFSAEDTKILSGLTADITVMTKKKNDVLYVPSRNIITRDGSKFVEVLLDTKSGVREMREISVGLRGSDGRTEILSGLEEGELIITD